MVMKLTGAVSKRTSLLPVNRKFNLTVSLVALFLWRCRMSCPYLVSPPVVMCFFFFENGFLMVFIAGHLIDVNGYNLGR